MHFIRAACSVPARPLKFMKLLRQTILFCIWLAAGPLAQAAETAGEVVLAKGNAFLQREGTRLRMPISAGYTVHTGDVFQTTSGGHLHIRLHDGGFIILRPESRVIIDEYAFRPKDPSATRVRLRLEEGVMRTITGEGIKTARHRFRLNTPIAAIGVSGTDFTTYTDSASTRVSVAKGRVVMSPLGGTCQAAAVGTCKGSGTRKLRAKHNDLMLVFNKGETGADIVPATDLAPDRMQPPLPGEP